MNFITRAYQDSSDIENMITLAAGYFSTTFHVIDLPYRLTSWAMNDPENIRLWFDEDGNLAAWAFCNTPMWAIDYACREEDEEMLFPQLVEWTCSRVKQILGSQYGHSSWYFNIFSGQSRRRIILERFGFVCQADLGEDSWSKVYLRRLNDTLPRRYTTPDGFKVRRLRGQSEVEKYVELHQAVFETKNMTIEWRKNTLLQPGYDSSLDLVVETPDQHLAAFCVCWMRELPDGRKVGQVEPLGCHKDYRRFALGRVALSEGLCRLYEAGVREVFVETDLYRNTAFRLYESFGFMKIQDVLIYRLDIDQLEK